LGRPATGQVAARWPIGLSVGDRLCPLPTPSSDRARNGHGAPRGQSARPPGCRLSARPWPRCGRRVQPSAYVDACPWQPQRAYVAVPRCCTGRLARASTQPGARPQHAFKSARLGPAQVTESVAWTACPPNLASGSGRPACRPDRWRCMSYLDGRECLCCNESVNCPLPKLAVWSAKSPPNQVTGNLAA
jgi:hypothetical protein